MDDIIATLDRALAERGLSDTAASRLAVGNPSLIKNLRANRGRKRYNYAALKSLADVLGLELYFGRPRNAIGTVMADAADLSGEPRKITAPLADAPSGFQPFAWHAQSSRTGLGPIAFANGWLSNQGLAPEALSFVAATPEAGANGKDIPILALVDRAAVQNGGPSLWCFRTGGADRIARLLWLEPDLLLILPDDTDMAPEVLQGIDRQRVTVLGRVVWVGQTHGHTLKAVPPAAE